MKKFLLVLFVFALIFSFYPFRVSAQKISVSRKNIPVESQIAIPSVASAPLRYLSTATSKDSQIDSLFNGVSSLTLTQFPGPILITGSNALPIIIGDKDFSPPYAVVGVASENGGRVIALGHDGFLSDSNIGMLSNEKFTTNSFNWLDKNGKKKIVLSTGHNEWLNVSNTSRLKNIAQSQGFTFEVYNGSFTSSVLENTGIVVIGAAWGFFTNFEIDCLKSFVKNGGGLFLLGLGWSWVANNTGKAIENYPMNKIGSQFGIKWVDGVISNKNSTMPIFQIFYPETLKYVITVNSALQTLKNDLKNHPSDLNIYLQSSQQVTERWVQCLETLYQFLDSATVEEKQSIFEQIDDIIHTYPQYFQKNFSYNLQTQSNLAWIREKIVLLYYGYANPLNYSKKLTILNTLSLDGTYKEIFEKHNVLILDNHMLPKENLIFLDNLLDSLLYGLHQLKFIMIGKDLGVPIEGLYILSPDERKLIYDMGASFATVNKAGYAIDLWDLSVNDGYENPFPEDVISWNVPYFCGAAGHELTHIIDFNLSGTLRAEREKLLKQAGNDHMNYLRSITEDGFFVKNPAEFLASIGNQWFTNTWNTLNLAIVRLNKNYKEPLNQFLFFAKVLSAEGDFVPFYENNIVKGGKFNVSYIRVVKNSVGNIIQIDDAKNKVRYHFDMDNNGIVQSVRKEIISDIYNISTTIKKGSGTLYPHYTQVFGSTTFSLLLEPEESYKILKLVDNSADVTEKVKNFIYVLDNVNENHSIEVYYEKVEETVNADSGQWVEINNGLYGGSIRFLAIDPNNNQIIYAGTYYDGVFKSTDGGNNWNKTSLIASGTRSLAIDPQNAKIIYAATLQGLYKSTNGGLNWKRVNAGSISTPFSTIVIDPKNPNILYAGTYYGEGILKSTDGGKNWSNVGLSNIEIRFLAIDPTNTQIIYAGTWSKGIYKSTDGGVNWSIINKGLTNRNIRNLAIDPQNANIIYAGTEKGLFKSIDSGSNWTNIIKGLIDTEIFCFDINPENTLVLYAGTGDGSLYKSTDGGTNWFKLTTWIENVVLSFAIDPTNTQVIYAGTWSKGIYKSTDGGVNWSIINKGLTNSIKSIAINPSNSHTIFAGTKGAGIFKSTDGGTNWYAINTGLTDSYINSIVVDPKNTDSIYIGTKYYGIFKSTDGGINWNSVNAGLKITSVASLAVDPLNTQTLYAGTGDGSLYKSTDGGTNWFKLTTWIENVVLSFAIDPTNTQVIYAGTWSKGIYKSTNGGTSWSGMNTGLTNTYVYSLAIDPTNTQIIYAGTYGDGIFKSTDGGTNWYAINTGLTDPFSSFILSFAIDPKNTNIIYAGSLVGIFKSTDRGTSWKLMNAELEAYCFAIDPTNTQIIYTGTEDGAFKYTIHYSITAHSGTGGTISPSGTITVNYGDSKTFTITPNSGYKISNVKVDGKSVGAVSSYTFVNITSDHTIEATFELLTFIISVSSGPNGSISPSGTITVNYGDSKTFT
ncbi:MAG: VPS10 domain-containing protein, partial [Bacteroidales bacterium]